LDPAVAVVVSCKAKGKEQGADHALVQPADRDPVPVPVNLTLAWPRLFCTSASRRLAGIGLLGPCRQADSHVFPGLIHGEQEPDRAEEMAASDHIVPRILTAAVALDHRIT